VLEKKQIILITQTKIPTVKLIHPNKKNLEHSHSVPDYPLGTVPRAYENEELHEKKLYVWCISFLIYVKQKISK
jgi:hypothetical protein